MKLIIRWIITAIALLVAVALVPGIRVGSDALLSVAVMAIILGLVNAFVRPVLRALACGFIVLTLGLFLLVINALTLWLSSYIAREWLGVDFYVDGFWPAFWGGIVVSVVSFLLSLFVTDDER
ncbi:MAG: phage holin family protein [Chloroflexota bacterium]|nr:phage holin family protein [Chloroflexota bacterium]